jgi:hypothetical protein
MPEDNLFTKVKNAIRGQKSSFCSRSTSVTPLETLGLEESIQYTDCQGETIEIPYGDITITGGYIPDCVQGGSPISVRNVPVKLFIQYGTTDCNTPPPSSNIILLDCDKQTPYVVGRGSISTTLTKGDICYITFKDNAVTNGCYEIGDDTADASVDTIEGEPQSFGPGKCFDCGEAINVTITDCDEGTTYIVDPNTIPLTKDGVYLLYLYANDVQFKVGCYTIGNRTTSEFVATIWNDGSVVPFNFNDCPSCLNPPA